MVVWLVLVEVVVGLVRVFPVVVRETLLVVVVDVVGVGTVAVVVSTDVVPVQSGIPSL